MPPHPLWSQFGPRIFPSPVPVPSPSGAGISCPGKVLKCNISTPAPSWPRWESHELFCAPVDGKVILQRELQRGLPGPALLGKGWAGPRAPQTHGKIHWERQRAQAEGIHTLNGRKTTGIHILELSSSLFRLFPHTELGWCRAELRAQLCSSLPPQPAADSLLRALVVFPEREFSFRPGW